MAKKKTRPKAAEAKHYGYSIKIESRCTHDEREDKQWGSWSTEYDNSIARNGEKTDEYPDVASIHDIAPGSHALVVWVEWSTGDSFGHGKRTGTEILGLFKDAASAKSLKEQLEKDYMSYTNYSRSKPHEYNYKTPDGQVFTSKFAPWSGYFESLDSVNMDSVVIF